MASAKQFFLQTPVRINFKPVSGRRAAGHQG